MYTFCNPSFRLLMHSIILVQPHAGRGFPSRHALIAAVPSFQTTFILWCCDDVTFLIAKHVFSWQKKGKDAIRQCAHCKQALSISPKKILKDYSIGFIRVMTEEANLRPARQAICASGWRPETAWPQAMLLLTGPPFILHLGNRDGNAQKRPRWSCCGYLLNI